MLWLLQIFPPWPALALLYVKALTMHIFPGDTKHADIAVPKQMIASSLRAITDMPDTHWSIYAGGYEHVLNEAAVLERALP